PIKSTASRMPMKQLSANHKITRPQKVTLRSLFTNIAGSVLAVACALLLATVEFSTPALSQASQIPPGEQCFQATTGFSGMIGALGALTGGSGGTNGSYAAVALTGGSGTGATANITVSGGAVTAVTVINPGAKFVAGDIVSAASANIGGVTGFSVQVASTTINSSLAGGAVGMYIPGTLTAKQTWADSAQTIL